MPGCSSQMQTENIHYEFDMEHNHSLSLKNYQLGTQHGEGGRHVSSNFNSYANDVQQDQINRAWELNCRQYRSEMAQSCPNVGAARFMAASQRDAFRIPAHDRGNLADSQDFSWMVGNADMNSLEQHDPGHSSIGSTDSRSIDTAWNNEAPGEPHHNNIAHHEELKQNVTTEDELAEGLQFDLTFEDC
eukprot:CAMPEP_0206362336 /NCGR_PEP_ID=MMETSP0294-20121207/904_1 /ASSEMBLY_ACC=CAM_ASM_000327 /TAXON_ID=39354 /ORGANISM="Heterosigma akashiwo, Strain CCMP2393" /LENGTH=187 /DNA_ID=CAMNT_0053807407 /DNA_START=209 /DNA_END=772 /DNA_ORIENTATION=+